MYAVVSYRNTERGARNIMMERLAEERRRRQEAERIAWDAKLREEASRKAFESHRNEVIRLVRRRPGPTYRHCYASIEERACRVFKVTRNELRSDRRNAHVVLARQFVMYWVCRLTELSLPQTGRFMGRDHTTVLHGRKNYIKKRAEMGRNLRSVR